jgi:hypothetical protein
MQGTAECLLSRIHNSAKLPILYVIDTTTAYLRWMPYAGQKDSVQQKSIQNLKSTEGF